ncbi:cytochrome P450 [Sistotremastrum suecicum HHB10207 ss-3]|uniref:Cytochrome P450 n=1 Tax=Sistotremastrum suecicum HHB10207 ss-3 TaxID=1314776 RepID=A0A165XFN6_9AGAM|nr:cytochrome P450 [Sistotremastrum suecicum HHB10207 ss-3]
MLIVNVLDAVSVWSLWLIGIFLLYRLFRRENPLPLPPGPVPDFILGNLLHLPKSHEWRTYLEWGKAYGDVVHVSALGRHIIVLNSHKAAFDLLEKRSAIYSERPTLPMGGELRGFDQSLVLLPCIGNSRFRFIRKAFRHLMGSRSSSHFWSVEEQVTKRFISKLYSDIQNRDTTGANIPERIRWAAGALILRIGYGYPVEDQNDPFVAVADVAMDAFSKSTEPGVWLVDFVPILKHIPPWFPFLSFPQTAVKWKQMLDDLINKPHDWAVEQMAKGVAQPSLTKTLLDNFDKAPTRSIEDDIKLSTAALYARGSDTTVSSTYSFFLAMVMYPEAQARARKEIDVVLRNERLPSFLDRQAGKMPYLEALCKEVLRWAPVVPAGIPHVTRKDDQYRGWQIPAGSLVISNIWGISRDDKVYQDPYTFRPERFLTKVQGGDCETEDDIPLDPFSFCFGYGRRICPGRNLAELSTWISAAMTLSVFNIQPHNNETLKVEYTRGVITHPEPFKCCLTVRGPKAEALVRSIAADTTVYMGDIAEDGTDHLGS